MKKVFLWSLVVVMVTSMIAMFSLTGCKTTTETTAAATTAAATTAAATTAAATTAAETTVAAETTAAKTIDSLKGMTIGFLVPLEGHPFMERVWKSAQAEAEKNGLKLIVAGAGSKGWDLTVESANVDNFITQKVDAILFFTSSNDGSRASADRIVKAGIPLVMVIDTVTGWKEDGFIYVGSNFVGGAGAGDITEWLAKKINGKGNIVDLKGPEGLGVGNTRDEGVKNVLKNYPDIKIVFEQWGDAQRTLGTTLMEDALTKFKPGEIQGLDCFNDETALGALEAIRRAGRLKEFPIVSVDGQPEACKAVISGEMSCTAFQDAETIGMTGVDIAIKLLLGEEIQEKQIDVPWFLIDTPEKAKEKLAILGEPVE
jgi:ABC-type sugar transport system substrate-binding protein